MPFHFNGEPEPQRCGFGVVVYAVLGLVSRASVPHNFGLVHVTIAGRACIKAKHVFTHSGDDTYHGKKVQELASVILGVGVRTDGGTHFIQHGNVWATCLGPTFLGACPLHDLQVLFGDTFGPGNKHRTGSFR